MNFNKTRGAWITNKNITLYFLLAIVFFAISYFSLVFVFHQFADKSKFLSFKMFSLKSLILLSLLLIAYFSLDGMRLYFILKTLKSKISAKFMAQLVFINIFVSNVTPFATGGGFAQIYFLNKKGVPLGSAVVATTIRTLLAMLVFFIFTPLIILFDTNLSSIFPKMKILAYAAGFIFIYLAFLFLSIKEKKIVKYIVLSIIIFLNSIRLVSTKKYRYYIKRSFQAINSFSKNINSFFSGRKIYIMLSIVFTLLYLLALFMFSVVLIGQMNYKVSSISIILIQVIVTFIMYFAPTPGASGIAEGSYAFAFAHFIKKTDIVPLTFAWRFFTIYIGMVIGAIVFYVQIVKVNLKKNAEK